MTCFADGSRSNRGPNSASASASRRFSPVLNLIFDEEPRPEQAERDDGEDDDEEQAAARHRRPPGAYGCAGGRSGAF